MENIKIDDFLCGDDFELEFNLDDFEFIDEKVKKNKTIKPKLSKNVEKVKFYNAKEFVKKINLFPGEQIHGIVNGNFIFGDFIEALLVGKNVFCKTLYISTLSLSQNNIDSLCGLIEGGYIGNIVLILSNYFYSHEKNRLIIYLKDKLKDKCNIIIIRNHTKIILLEISNINIVISGSANLRSSNSIEQIIIQENKELFDFYKEFFESNYKFSISEA